tara:strand:- start:542 stop:817 length:276 start_codon:yes stop_codon:yes gene_type:complete
MPVESKEYSSRPAPTGYETYAYRKRGDVVLEWRYVDDYITRRGAKTKRRSWTSWSSAPKRLFFVPKAEKGKRIKTAPKLATYLKNLGKRWI